ncbi:MAG: hypothetical protein AAFX80_00195 [Cyanobacteria bacterium J06639_18]
MLSKFTLFESNLLDKMNGVVKVLKEFGYTATSFSGNMHSGAEISFDIPTDEYFLIQASVLANNEKIRLVLKSLLSASELMVSQCNRKDLKTTLICIESSLDIYRDQKVSDNNQLVKVSGVTNE